MINGAIQLQQAKDKRYQLEDQRQKRIRDAQILKACKQCDEDGWRFDDRAVKCSHQEAVNG